MSRFSLPEFLAQTRHDAETVDGVCAAIAAHLAELRAPPECVRQVDEYLRAAFLDAGQVSLPVDRGEVRPEVLQELGSAVQRHCMHWVWHTVLALVEVWHLKRELQRQT